MAHTQAAAAGSLSSTRQPQAGRASPLPGGPVCRALAPKAWLPCDCHTQVPFESVSLKVTQGRVGVHWMAAGGPCRRGREVGDPSRLGPDSTLRAGAELCPNEQTTTSKEPLLESGRPGSR